MTPLPHRRREKKAKRIELQAIFLMFKVADFCAVKGSKSKSFSHLIPWERTNLLVDLINIPFSPFLFYFLQNLLGAIRGCLAIRFLDFLHIYTFTELGHRTTANRIPRAPLMRTWWTSANLSRNIDRL